MKRTIGIITYHNAINYGAVLQSFALLHYVNSVNDVAEIINYNSLAIAQQYKMKNFKNSFSFLNFFAHNLTCIIHHKKKKKFIEFVNNHLILSKPVLKNNLFEKNNYSIIISGSDQVFNPCCNRNDKTFFIDFTDDVKKYSYAASIGSISQFRQANFDAVPLLEKFECISLREQESVDFLKSLINKRIILSVDPVWLLNASEWNYLIGSRKKRKPYILVYNLMDYKSMKPYVKRMAKEKKLRVITINRTIMGDINYFFCSNNKSNCSPIDFLGLIRDSDYFFTDSFHGTSFAMIFEKKFGVFLDNSANNTNSRIVNLLSLAGLTDRIVSSNDFDVDRKIDYFKVKNGLNDIINESKLYIKDIVRE